MRQKPQKASKAKRTIVVCLVVFAIVSAAFCVYFFFIKKPETNTAPSQTPVTIHDGGGSGPAVGVDEFIAKALKLSPGIDLRATPNIVINPDSVSLFFPGEMFKGIELNEEFITTNRYIDARRAGDGRVIIEMSEERQLEFLFAFADDVEYNRQYFLSELAYVTAITYSEDMRFMYFFVNAKMNKDILYELPYIFSNFLENYQMMLGKEAWSLMTVVDDSTNKPMFGLVFPGGIEVN